MRCGRRAFVTGSAAAGVCTIAWAENRVRQSIADAPSRGSGSYLVQVAEQPPQQRASRSSNIINFEEAGGSVSNTGDRNRRIFGQTIARLNRSGGGTLFVPAKVYPFSGESADVGTNVTVSAEGATFQGDECRITIDTASDAYNIHGLNIIDTSGSSSNFLLNCRGSNCHFKDVHLEKRPAAGGYIGYCQHHTSGNLFENFSFAGSNGVFLSGSNHEVRGGRAEAAGGDDCWALKATVGSCENFRISGFRASGFAALISIGSEIGSHQQDNPGHSLYVRGVTVENCEATGCTYFAYIKPGGVEVYDYRDGLVEDVTISNCRVEDPAGLQFRNAVYVSPGRGAIVRRLTVTNLAVRGRGRSPATQNIAPIYIHVLGTTNGAGRGATVEDVVIRGLTCVDPHGGLARSASTPGEPIHSEVVIEKQVATIGHIGRVEVDGAQTNGCARMAVVVGSNIDGPVRIANSEFLNFAAAVMASSDAKAIVAHSSVEVENVTATPAPTAPPGTTGLP